MVRFGLAALCLLLACSSRETEAWSPAVTKRSWNNRILSSDGRPHVSSTRPNHHNVHRHNIVLHAASTTLSSSKDLILYNTRSRQKELFKTQVPKEVSMYTCGPTVYDSAHVGNFRAFLTYDVLKRVLQYFGNEVNHVCNLTDVDDKIIAKCSETGLDVETITKKYTQAFMDDLQALNILPANQYPKATEHIAEMVELVQLLEKNGLAYQTPEGSWYFAVDKQPGYGQQLVQINFDDMEASQRNFDEEHKQGPFDFCLWKAYKQGVDRDDATWETALGKGRPGWHLECSAMARKYLGDTLDVHCGGVDLTFPHHENEIAQSEGATGKPFCNCWIHNGFVNIGKEKMSKSLGNFVTLRAACPKPNDVRAYRYLVVSSHYRNPLSFTDQAMGASKAALKRMDKIQIEIDEALKEGGDDNVGSMDDSEIASKVVPAQIANFEAALLDDLSMPRAAASLFACVKAAENEFKRVKKDDKSDEAAASSPPLDLAGLQAVRDAMGQMDKVFGIFYQVPMTQEEEAEAVKDAMVPLEVMDLVEQRSAAKDAKDWELADSLRARIKELGFAVKDVKGGEPIVSRMEE